MALCASSSTSLPSSSRRMRTSPLPVEWSASQVTPASRSFQALPRASSTAAAAAQRRQPLRRPRRGAARWRPAAPEQSSAVRPAIPAVSRSVAPAPARPGAGVGRQPAVQRFAAGPVEVAAVQADRPFGGLLADLLLFLGAVHVRLSLVVIEVQTREPARLGNPFSGNPRVPASHGPGRGPGASAPSYRRFPGVSPPRHGSALPGD